MPKRPVTVENPFDDPDFVASLSEDVAAEMRGEPDEGLTLEEFRTRYAEYLPQPG
jgi:hypothetical protein